MAGFTDEHFELIAGIINSQGELQKGPTDAKIAEVRKDGVGLYIIRFATKYLEPPVVVATLYGADDESLSSDGGTTRDNVVVVAVDQDEVKFKTGDNNGRAIDRQFAFTAIGFLPEEKRSRKPGMETDYGGGTGSAAPSGHSAPR